MTQSPGETNAPPADAIFPADLLEGGEVVILAVKPSGWFVLLVSWRVLVGAGVLGGAAYLGEELLHVAGPYPAVLLICAAAGCVRVIFACFQWVGRLYVLTNRRVIRIGGVIRPDVYSRPLRQIRDVLLRPGPLERPLRVGTLYFDVTDGDLDARWTCLARPAEVRETVLEAVRRAR